MAVRRHTRADGGLGLRVEIGLKTTLVVALGIGTCWVLIRLFPVFLVIVAALFLVGALNPLVEALERRGLKRGRGIAAVFISVFLLFAGLAAVTLPSLAEELQNVAEREPAIREHIAAFLAQSRITAPLAESLREVHYGVLAKEAAGTALALSTRAIEIIGYTVSSVFLSLYLMIDRDSVRGGLFALVPRHCHLRLSRILINLETIVGGYIRGQVITSALMMGFVFGLLTICRVQNALAIGVFAGAADVLPYIGVFLSVGPMAFAAASKGIGILAIVVVVTLAYEEFESRVLVPKIYGSALRLSSSVVFVSLLIGGTLLGIVGALLALPVAAGVKMLIEELRVGLPGEAADDGELRERDARAEEEYATRTQGVPAERAAAIAVEISEELQTEEHAHASGPTPSHDRADDADEVPSSAKQPVRPSILPMPHG